MAQKKIGLMGCGTVAGYGHLPALKESEYLDLAAIYDPDERRLAEAKERFDVPQAFSDSEEFFNSDIDAVSICSPAPCHYQNVLDAAKYGKHVLCEKPLAQSPEEGEEMVRAMEKAGMMLFTAYCYRFSPMALQVKQLIEEKAIGDLRSLRLIFIWNCHGRFEKGSDGKIIEAPRRAGRMLEGGPMADCGSHQIDLARWWTGSEIASQESFGAWVENYEAPDHQYLHMEHKDGAHTMTEMSFSYCHTCKEPIHYFSYHLIGTDGIIRYDKRENIFEMRNSKETVQFPTADVKNFPAMYDAFAVALQTGNAGHLPVGREGLIATRIARESVRQAIGNR